LAKRKAYLGNIEPKGIKNISPHNKMTEGTKVNIILRSAMRILPTSVLGWIKKVQFYECV
jgi:hypothetical protein